MLAYALHAERAEVIDGGAQADRFGDHRRARLKLPRQLLPARALTLDGLDHIAAGEERRHRFEQGAVGVENTDPRRAERLMPGPGIEVGTNLAHVDRDLRHRLCAVDKHQRPRGVCALDDLGDRVDRAEHV